MTTWALALALAQWSSNAEWLRCMYSSVRDALRHYTGAWRNRLNFGEKSKNGNRWCKFSSNREWLWAVILGS